MMNNSAHRLLSRPMALLAMFLLFWLSPMDAHAQGNGSADIVEDAISQQAAPVPVGEDAIVEQVVQLVPAIPPISPLPSEASVSVFVPEYSSGLNLDVTWIGETPGGYAVLRSESQSGPWALVADGLLGEVRNFEDTLTSDTRIKLPPEHMYYRVSFKDAHIQAKEADVVAAKLAITVAGDNPPKALSDALISATADYEAALLKRATAPVMGTPSDSWFNLSRTALLVLIVVMGVLIVVFTKQARAGKEIYIRRIPGVDAIEEAVGRATEMGKPILYVPGIGEFQEIQTIASLLILGRVAEIVANYESDIIVPCTYPIVREVADESVRQGYFQAGRPDAYNAHNVRFISSEQFAFTASTNGIILREEPAANIYLGQFFAESLILAETGFVNKSIQIAGTAETAQIPFFVTACDYTLIGEELYAVSAYLTREPRLTSSLKASDWVRVALIILLFLGTLELAFGSSVIKDMLTFN